MFWIRLENLAKRPMDVNVDSFVLTDEEGHTYPELSAEAAFDRLNAATLGRKTFLSNAAKGISLGRNGVTPEELKDETMRFSFQSGKVQEQGLKQGLIFFEAPNRKKFTLTLRLGDLWSKPLVFSSVKPK
jgi:hypothetical protein